MTTFHSINYFGSSEGAGHFYHYHSAVQKALQPHLKEVSIYVPLHAQFAVPTPGWKNWFHPFYNKRTRKKFWKDCVRLFRQPSQGKRIFFIEFFGRKDFFLYSLAAFLFAKKQDVLWVLYRDDLAIRRKKDYQMIRLCSKFLKWKYKNRFVPLTDSALLADYYKAWFGKPLPVLPILYTDYKPVTLPQKKHLVCTCLGGPRPEKGMEDIARLVQIKDPLSAQVELDLSGATYLPPIRNNVQVHLHKAFLVEEEYGEVLKRSDVVLMPYDPQKYKRRTSGIFVETILAGKIPLVKEGSWLAHELKRFDLHELIVDWNDSLFFTNLFRTLENPHMLEKLKKMQQDYLAFHGQENFARSLLDLCQHN